MPFINVEVFLSEIKESKEYHNVEVSVDKNGKLTVWKFNEPIANFNNDQWIHWELIT